MVHVHVYDLLYSYMILYKMHTIYIKENTSTGVLFSTFPPINKYKQSLPLSEKCALDTLFRKLHYYYKNLWTSFLLPCLLIQMPTFINDILLAAIYGCIFSCKTPWNIFWKCFHRPYTALNARLFSNIRIIKCCIFREIFIL